MSNITSQQLQQAMAIINQASSQQIKLQQKQGGSWANKLIGTVALAGLAAGAFLILQNSGYIKTAEASYVDAGVPLKQKDVSKVKKRIYEDTHVLNTASAVANAKVYAKNLTNEMMANLEIKQEETFEQSGQESNLANYACKEGIGECPNQAPVFNYASKNSNVYVADGLPAMPSTQEADNRLPRFSSKSMPANPFSKNSHQAPPAYKVSKKETKRQLQALGKSDPIKDLIALNRGIQ